MITMQRIATVFVCLIVSVYAVAQAPAAPPAQGERPRRGGDMPEGMREMFQNAVSGTIEAINGNTFTMKRQDGSVSTVKTSGDTMMRRERGGGAAKLTDFKVGETVIVGGDSKGETINARFVALRPNGPNAMNPEDLGKKFITGEVAKIDGTQLTIKRPDGVEQTIEVDDDTSFRNAKRESITLADVKVGDRVMGRGELKNGTFVPATLMVGIPDGMMMRRERPNGSGHDATPPPPAGDQKPKQD